ncbi:MAG: hypothetical protein AAF391_09315, partial [Bacteroidota bacterium]
YRYLPLNNYDSLLSIGGAGNRENGFLEIQKISLPNRQQLYALDVSQQEISILNQDLKIVRRFSFWNQNDFLSQAEPVQASNFAVGQSGDLFMLNDLDNKIYVYNVFGELILNMGGNDYGPGNLMKPVDLWLNSNNLLYVLEGRSKEIKVFDNQGTFQSRILPKLHKSEKVFLEDSFLVYLGAQEVLFHHLQSSQNYRYTLSTGHLVQDVQITKEFIYLLSNSGIYKYARQ